MRADARGEAYLDYGVAHEVFVQQHYKSPRCLDVAHLKVIVDLGANVGYSCLYWMELFPNCEIIAVEPHPIHMEHLRRNMALNGYSHQITTYEAAAGCTSRSAILEDRGASSRLADTKSGAFAIQTIVVDIFDLLKGKRIDLLKMDIEGAEYEILGDNRFATLELKAIVLEWHQTGAFQDGRRWCVRRLEDLGYSVQDTHRENNHGILWAYRE
ncbi:MAG: FkbM family methyltransferase [Gammaproteobacteria bacterium]